ncbi:MAG: hypothetical protein ACI4V4_01085 [Eubacterium sp.]
MLDNLNYKKIKLEKTKEYWLALVFTLIPVAIFAISLSNKTMPLAEGWYTYYAQLINEGQVVYRDFEYLFMPGYITFIALFTKIFGYNIIALRVLGVIFFMLITYFAFKIFNELFTPMGACLGATVTAFYLQSEVVQIFYDYIRFMDMFAYITIFLLIKMSKNYIYGKNIDYKITILAGAANAMVLMTKQNIGLLFGFFVLCYFIFLFLYKSEKKNVFVNLLLYGLGAGIIFAVYGVYLFANGALGACLEQTLFGATEAKGGIKAILFNWIIQGKNSFINEKKVVIFVVLVGLAFILLNVFFPAKGNNEKSRKIVFGVYAVLAPVGILTMYMSDTFTKKFTDVYTSYTYGFYTFVTLVFFIMMICYIIEIFKKKRKLNDFIGFFFLCGAIFAIGYGVGMSGGLVASQIALSTGLIICILLSLCQGKFSWISMSLVSIGALCFVMFCGAYKYVSTYNWWGLTDSSVWEATEEMDIDIFKGIKVSEDEKKIYEGINNYVQEYTDEDDDIFAFPHTPILYTATNRHDPGTFTKVQWYDVATNESVKKDIAVIEEKQPKVIIIYNIPQFAIDSHESAFNKNKESATTTMSKTLKKYCLRNSYIPKENYKINSYCSITVWVKDDDMVWYSSGIGTKEDPFIISNKEQFLNFAEVVNGGVTFEGFYVALDSDIDLSGVKNYTPIGNEKIDASFDGRFDGQGHVIKNLRLVVDPTYKELTEEQKKKIKNYKEEKPNNVAVFGSVKGTIMNLGLEDCEISGYCAAGLVRQSSDADSNIVNCYVKNCKISGKLRAGAIADDYVGYVYNCYAINVDLDADKFVGVIAYRTAGIRYEECYTNIKYYNDLTNVTTLKEINSSEFAANANKNVKAYVELKTTTKKSPRPIYLWTIKDSEFGFSKDSYTTVQEPQKVK